MSTQDAVRRRVEETLAEPLAAAGYDVEGVDLTPAGRRRVLRVSVDRDGGVSLDDVADLTREVSRLLDDGDVMGQQPYTLEVTSRGVDRPLTLPRHYRRNVSRLVEAELTDGSSLVGRITAADDDTATLEVDGSPRVVALADVRRALVQVEFNRRPTQQGADQTTDETTDETIDETLDETTDETTDEGEED